VAVHVITLDRTPERREKFGRRNAHLQRVVRFSAVDGKQLDLAALRRDGLLQGDPPYTPGAIGAALSHATLWRKAAATGETLTIAEDDAVFAQNFEAASAQLLATLPADWEFVLWGWNFDAYLWVELIPGVSPAVLTMDQNRMRQNIEAFPEQTVAPQPMKLLHSFGLPCYSVTPRGAQRMLEFCLPIRPLMIAFEGFGVVVENRSGDMMLNGIMPKLNGFVSIPPLVLTENRRELSTIWPT
jgi:GR25 family glycosyltransferase involved in LPS biosynthesis